MSLTAEMAPILRSTRLVLKRKRPQCHRAIATHTHSHHANQISILRSSVDTSSADFKDNAAAMDDVMARMKDLRDTISQGGSQRAREKHVQRGKMLPREYVDPVYTSREETIILIVTQSYNHSHRSRNLIPGTFSLRRPRPLSRRRCAFGRYSHRHRHGLWCDMHDRCQRQHRKRRDILPHHCQETLACTRNRTSEPVTMYLPRRFRWCEFTAPSRRVPRP